jgi:hypothetical protein
LAAQSRKRLRRAVHRAAPAGNLRGGRHSAENDEAIAALLTRPSVEEAARTIGVEPKTLRRWMRVPEFQAAYLQARREAVTQALARMQQGSGAAASVMFKLMVDASAPPAVRLRAAEWLVQNAIKGIELEDIEARVTALEQANPKNGRKR